MTGVVSENGHHSFLRGRCSRLRRRAVRVSENAFLRLKSPDFAKLRPVSDRWHQQRIFCIHAQKLRNSLSFEINAPEIIRKLWLAHTLRDMKQEAVFRELTVLFRSNGVRFCPIKGADLAWCVYPSGALRPKCDLDILLPEQEIPQALALLKANG